MTISCDKCPKYNKVKYWVGNFQYCVFETALNLEEKVFIVRDDIDDCIRIYPRDVEYKNIMYSYKTEKVANKLTE